MRRRVQVNGRDDDVGDACAWENSGLKGDISIVFIVSLMIKNDSLVGIFLNARFILFDEHFVYGSIDDESEKEEVGCELATRIIASACLSHQPHQHSRRKLSESS